jgi:hypothetical protein
MYRATGRPSPERVGRGALAIRVQWPTQGGAKPTSSAGSCRCSRAFRQDKAAMSWPGGRQTEGADSLLGTVVLTPWS